MGGVAGALFVMWVRSGFSTAEVASALTFFPPKPTYRLPPRDTDADVENDATTTESSGIRVRSLPAGVEECHKVKHLIPDNRNLTGAEVHVYMLTTRVGNRIPCFMLLQPHAKYTLIFSHGNATDCGAMYSRYIYMSKELGINIAAYDYSGYGAATGRPTEANTYTDITAVYDFIASQFCDNPAQQILVYGQSVGSGPSIYLASRNQVAGLVIHSGILSGMRVLTNSRALGCLDIYPNVNRIRKVTCPTLVIHGRLDEEVNIVHGYGLYEALPLESKVEPYWVETAGHNDIGDTFEGRREYIQRLRQFFQYVTSRSG